MSRSSARSTPASIRSSVATFGLLDGLLYLAARTIERLSRGRCRLIKYYLVAQPVAEERLARGGAREGFEVSQVGPHDPIVAAFPRPAHVNHERFARGAVCFAASTQGRFVGHIWISKDQHFEDEVRCLYRVDPPDRAVWDFDVYVEPKYRLGMAFARLWDAVNETLLRDGFRWTLSRISAFNAPSLAAHERLGLVRMHAAVFLCLGRFQLALLTCYPYAHASRTEGPRLALRVASDASSRPRCHFTF